MRPETPRRHTGTAERDVLRPTLVRVQPQEGIWKMENGNPMPELTPQKQRGHTSTIGPFGDGEPDRNGL